MNYKKILFYADGARGEKSALAYAASLAEDLKAQLVVMDVVAMVSSDDKRLSTSIRKLQDSLIRERGDVLDELIASVDVGQSRIRKLVVPGKDYNDVIRTVVTKKFDLLVKSVNRQSRLSSALLGRVDIRLLHHCPCPVLILKPSRRKQLKSILAAVNPVADNRTEQKLNASIMESAIGIAEIEDADLAVVHALEKKLPEHLDARQHKDELKLLSDSLRDDSERRMQQLVADYAHVDLSDHLIAGKPHKVISKFIKDNDVDLLVMGTVARSGVQGLVIGNTAEKILDHVDCSILTLKPPGWTSAVK